MPKQLPVFVYGTLLSGFHNDSGYIKPFPHTKTRATIKGEIYHLPEGYPGLLMTDAGKVAGEIVDFAPEVYEKALAGLDELETYYGEGDSRNEYERIPVTARVQETGQEVEVYVYRYLDEAYVKRVGTRVEHGDWRAFMERAE